MQKTRLTNSAWISLFNNAILALIILVILGSWSYAMFGPKGKPPIDEEKLASVVQQRLKQHAPEIEREAKRVAADILPPLSKAIVKQSQEDYDRYMQTLQKQGGQLAEHSEVIFVDAVKAQYSDYLQAHREVLAEEFPNHADKKSIDQLIAQFEKVGHKMIERFYLEDFAKQAKRTEVAWSKIQPVKEPAPGDPSLEKQLIDYGTDWSVLAFTDKAKQSVLSD
ncbi:hypothetical protein GC197_13410 [bacterium]|nr:hypothetical protein [bacterium]